jgi:putative two-component system response regulator
MEAAEPGLILAGDRLADMDGAEFCRRVRRVRSGRFASLVLMGARAGAASEVEALAAGADEYLRLPVDIGLFRARVHAQLRRKAVHDEREDIEAVLFSLARAVEHRDAATSGHCERLARISARIGRRLGLSSAEIEALHRGGFLHDIGKLTVPDTILFKPGPLSPSEWEIMASHTVKGEAICKPLKNLASVLPIVRHHHERFDGSGYPDGLAGEQIPLLARILQIADIFDALTATRPYKPALTASQAIATLREEARLGWRDPDLVRVFSELSGEVTADLAPEPPVPLLRATA